MGFVRLSDDLSGWEWFDDKNTVYVYVWLMLRAAWCATRYHGVDLERGQAVTTFAEITQNCGVSMQQARTILERLKSTNKITVKTTPKFSIITMLEYDCDKKTDNQNNTQTTNKQQAAQQSNNKPTLYNTNNQNTNDQTSRALREGGGFESGFDKFWEAYPKKTAKANAVKAWKKLDPDEELQGAILTSLERQKSSVQWTKDNGQYIPYPASWLNGRRWEDEALQAADDSRSGWSNEPLSDEEKNRIINDFFN